MHQAPAAAWFPARLLDMSTMAEKDPIASKPEHDVEVGPEVEHGHLKELEVDVAKVLVDDQSFDFDSDHSPYPEGMPYVGRGGIESDYPSASCRARSRRPLYAGQYSAHVDTRLHLYYDWRGC
jgi:hypothetical protein